MYKYSIKPVRNFCKSLKDAESGNVKAMLKVGLHYFYQYIHIHEAKSMANTIYWLEKAIEGASGDAYYWLGECMIYEPTTFNNGLYYKERMKWMLEHDAEMQSLYELAKPEGILERYLNVIVFFSNEAENFYKLSIAKGNSAAMARLGQLYINEWLKEGKEEVFQQASHWLREASKQCEVIAVEVLLDLIKQHILPYE